MGKGPPKPHFYEVIILWEYFRGKEEEKIKV